MERVPLSVFVDFSLAVGVKRVQIARAYKDSRHTGRKEFYDAFRKAIGDFHRKEQPPSALDSWLATVEDKRKRLVYPGLVEGYRRWLSHAPMRWIDPPHTLLPVGNIEIDVRPDFAVEIAGARHIIVAHFGAVLSKKRINMIQAITNAALGPTRPGWRFGLLDVSKAKYYTMKTLPNPRFGLAVRGDAHAFVTIYDAV